MNSASSSPDRRPVPLEALRTRVDAFWQEALGDLAVERGWISDAQLEALLERIDRGATDLPLAGLLLVEGLLTAEQLDELRRKAPAAELTRTVDEAKESMPPEAREASRDPALRFGRFILVREIGSGGMGVVHRAWQSDLGRWVALKRLRTDSIGSAARFRREGRLAAQVIHPNLVPIYEVGEIDGNPYLAMALIEGGSLEGQQLPIRRALEIVMQIARAVHELHGAGILHRDIKPGNILVDRASDRIYLGDFSLARSEDPAPALSRSGMMVGTPAYAPPEQIRGERSQTGPASDVYGLGATLHALLTGTAPFSGHDLVEVANRVIGTDPVPIRSLRPDVNNQIQLICWKAMRKQPEDRYASAVALADDLQRYLNGETLLARPPGLGERLKSVIRRHRTPAALGLSLLLVAGLAIAALVAQGIRHAQAREGDRIEKVLIEASWRAEDMARDSVEWAEVRGFIGGAMPAEQVDPVRRRLVDALRPLETDDATRRLVRAVLARFDLLIDEAKGEAAFASILDSSPADAAARLQRLRARLARYLAAIPLPLVSISRTAGTSASLDELPSPKAEELKLAVREDLEILRKGPAGSAMRRDEALDPFLQGVDALLAGRTEEALQAFHTSTNRVGSRDESMRLAGFAHLLNRQYDEAVEAWTVALGRSPNRSDLRLFYVAALAVQAARRADEGKADEFRSILGRARAEAGRLTGDHPGWPVAHGWRGRLDWMECMIPPPAERRTEAIERMKRAAESFEKAWTLEPGMIDHAISRANALGSLADLEGAAGRDPEPGTRAALEALERIEIPAIDRPGFDARTRQMLILNRGGLKYKLALIAESRGEGKEAEQRYRASIADYDALLEMSGADEAHVRFAKGLACASLSSVVRRSGREGASEWASAAKEFTRAVELEPGRERVRLLIARTGLNIGRGHGDAGILDFGLAQADALLAKGEETIEAWELRADLHRERALLEKARDASQARWTSAVADYGRAIGMNGGLARLFLKRSFARGALSELHEDIPAKAAEDLALAFADAERACALDEAYADAWYQAGVVAVRLERKPEAAERLRKALPLMTAQDPRRGEIETLLEDLGRDH